MNRKLTVTALVTVIAALLAFPSGALAGVGQVLRDCTQDGTLNGHYSQGELQNALDNLPSDVDEYTDCRAVIREAALSKAGGDKGSNPQAAASSVDNNAAQSQREASDIAKATKSDEAVKINGKAVKPGDAGFLAASFDNDVPTLLIVLMALFGTAAILGAGFAAQRRWPAVAKPFKAIGRGVKSGTSRFRR